MFRLDIPCLTDGELLQVLRESTIHCVDLMAVKL